MHFIPNRKLLVLTAILLPVLLLLGNWQLQRAEEKKSLLQQLEIRRNLPPVALQNLDTRESLRYRQVILQGYFDNTHSFLLDNRVHNGRAGYDVLTPLNDENGGRVLVNRGWIAAPLHRDQLPEIPVVEQRVQIAGTIYQPLSDVEKLQTGKGWPRVVQTLHFDQLAQELGEDLLPFTVRLDRSMAGVLVTGWPVVNVQPEKHTAYAIQWFAMAFALVVLTLYASLKQLPKAESG